jgi:hypothetical protein
MMTVARGCAHIRRFTEPDQYQAAVRGGESLYSVLGRGVFEADLTDVQVGGVKVQRGRETLPRLAASAVGANKVGVLVWPHEGPLPVVRGVQVRRGELLCSGPGQQSHHRTTGSNEFVALLMDVPTLAAAVHDLTGREPDLAGVKLLRPPERLLTRLHALILSVIRIHEEAPPALSAPPSAGGFEGALLEAVVACLMHRETSKKNVTRMRRTASAKKLEEEIEANLEHPLNILNLCRIAGRPERSLRKLFQEQMGV